MDDTNNNVIECMVYLERFNEKPDKFQTGSIQKNIHPETIQIEYLAESLVNGASFKPGVLIGGRSKDDWKRQQLFGLDFDDGTPIEISHRKAIDLGLTPIFMYTTFSHTSEHNKYRMIFCADEMVTDGNKRDKLQATLMGVMGDIDKVCFNRDRLFFGGKGKEVLFPSFDARINADEVINTYWKDEYAAFISGSSSSNKKKITNKKNTKNASTNVSALSVINYEPLIDEEVKVAYPVKCVSMHNLKCLQDFFDYRAWFEGDHRERFIFIYYNCSKIVNGSAQAFKECLEYNNKMSDPLSIYELKSAIMHTDEHIESKDWYRLALHDNGSFIFKPETIISEKWLDIDENLARDCGFFDNKINKENVLKNKERDKNRDRLIAELYLSGLGYQNVAKALPEEYKCCKNTVRRTVERLGIKDRNISINNIQFEEKEKYKRVGVQTLTKLEKVQSHPIFSNITSVDNRNEITDENNKNSREDNHSKGNAAKYFDKNCEILANKVKEANKAFNDNEQDIAVSTILANPDTNYCLYGKAGTGKSFCIDALLQRLSEEERKRTVVIAPTGIAASNITYTTATTIHSLFELHTFIYSKDSSIKIPNKLLGVRRIIIDEIGMVRKDIFTQLIRVVKAVEEKTGNKIQLIFSGDYGQISPVVTKKDKAIIDMYYKESKDKYFCFDSPLWSELNLQNIVLRNNHRHNNDNNDELQEEFISICDDIKFGLLNSISWLNNNLSHTVINDAIYLCANNKQVDNYNSLYTKDFTETQVYKAKIELGERYNEGFNLTNVKLPVKAELKLAVGMRVMTLVNTKSYKNGSLGTITALLDNKVKVKLDSTGREVTVRAAKFDIENLEESNIYQIPIAIAYAITVNKAQGLTLDKANIVPGFFAPGQLYTAITRIKNVHNISIIGELNESDLVVDSRALSLIA